MKLIWGEVAKYKFYMFILLLLIIVGALLESTSFTFIIPFLEKVLNAQEASQITNWLNFILNRFPSEHAVFVIGSLMLGIIFFKAVIYLIRISLASRFVWRLKENWMNKILEYYLYIPFSRSVSEKHGVMVNNLMNEPFHSANSLRNLIDIYARVILCISLYVVLLGVSWQLTLILTVFMFFLMYGFNTLTRRYSFSVGRRRLQLNQELTAHGTEILAGIRQIKTFGMEQQSAGVFRTMLSSLSTLQIKFDLVRALPQPVNEFLIVGGFLIVLIYLGLAEKTEFTSVLPTLGLFAAVLYRISQNLSYIHTYRIDLSALLPSLKLVRELSSSAEIRKNFNAGVFLDSLDGDIVFEDGSFSYSESGKLFEGLSFDIPYRQVTVLTGDSGAGKSTLADIVTGLYSLQKGRVLINGVDLDTINLSSWHRLIGFVSQDTFLLNTSIRENILIGKPDATEAELAAAAEKAGAHNFIVKQPDGYLTVIGDRGIKLSGGQKQRIAIARAIIRDPQLLIFDEATNSLDSTTERWIWDFIRGMKGRVTVLIISHRGSAIEHADVVLRVKNGTVQKLRQGMIKNINVQGMKK